ncbi:MAG: hypothetical protein AAFU03_04725 [Bacteroidota bacterium]
MIVFTTVAYLILILRAGLFEVAHVASHRLAGEQHQHSHHHPGEADHEHGHLKLLKDTLGERCDFLTLLDNGPNKPTRQLTQPNHKIAHTCASLSSSAALLRLKKKKIPFFDLQLPAAPFLEQPTPPPDFVGCALG